MQVIVYGGSTYRSNLSEMIEESIQFDIMSGYSMEQIIGKVFESLVADGVVKLDQISSAFNLPTMKVV